jgi:hypothetical protein
MNIGNLCTPRAAGSEFRAWFVPRAPARRSPPERAAGARSRLARASSPRSRRPWTRHVSLLLASSERGLLTTMGTPDGAKDVGGAAASAEPFMRSDDAAGSTYELAKLCVLGLTLAPLRLVLWLGLVLPMYGVCRLVCESLSPQPPLYICAGLCAAITTRIRTHMGGRRRSWASAFLGTSDWESYGAADSGIARLLAMLRHPPIWIERADPVAVGCGGCTSRVQPRLLARHPGQSHSPSSSYSVLLSAGVKQAKLQRQRWC